MSLDTAFDAVGRRHAEAFARVRDLRARVQNVARGADQARQELSRLLAADRELVSQIAALRTEIATLSARRDDLRQLITSLEEIRRRMQADHLAVTARAREARTTYWSMLSALVPANQLPPPHTFMPPITALAYATLYVEPRSTGVPAQPLAKALGSSGSAVGPLARARSDDDVLGGTLAERLQQVSNLRRLQTRLETEVWKQQVEAGGVSRQVEAARAERNLHVHEREALARRRDALAAAVEKVTERLRAALPAARAELHALWRTAKEELFWNSAVEGLQRAAGATFGRHEALRQSVRDVLGGWERLLGSLPDAVAEAGSPDVTPSHVKATALSMAMMYQKLEPRNRPARMTTPQNVEERNLWDVVFKTRAGVVTNTPMDDANWPAEFGFRKYVWPPDSEYGVTWDGVKVRQLHYNKGPFGEFTDVKFKDGPPPRVRRRSP